MKPIIIYQDRKDDKISLTKRDFEKYIQEAYDEGYNSGFNYASRLYYTPLQYPYWYNTSASDHFPYHTEVTCTGTDTQWLSHPTVTAAEVPPCTLTTANTTEKIKIKYKENNK